MTVIKIRVGRTYNTGNYTSQRFEMEAELDEGENVRDATRALARILHETAWATMADQRVERVAEPGGSVSLTRRTEPAVEDEDDDIPY